MTQLSRIYPDFLAIVKAERAKQRAELAKLKTTEHIYVTLSQWCYENIREPFLPKIEIRGSGDYINLNFQAQEDHTITQFTTIFRELINKFYLAADTASEKLQWESYCDRYVFSFAVFKAENDPIRIYIHLLIPKLGIRDILMKQEVRYSSSSSTHNIAIPLPQPRPIGWAKNYEEELAKNSNTEIVF